MKTFQELGICDEILKAITKLGYENPMPVQEQVIPHLLNEETDLVALAQTGTGKTAAFGLPVIQRIDLSLCKPQALILSPTRELCLQIPIIRNMSADCVYCPYMEVRVSRVK